MRRSHTAHRTCTPQVGADVLKYDRWHLRVPEASQGMPQSYQDTSWKLAGGPPCGQESRASRKVSGQTSRKRLPMQTWFRFSFLEVTTASLQRVHSHRFTDHPRSMPGNP